MIIVSVVHAGVYAEIHAIHDAILWRAEKWYALAKKQCEEDVLRYTLYTVNCVDKVVGDTQPW